MGENYCLIARSVSVACNIFLSRTLKYLQSMYQRKDLYPEYIKNSYNSKIKTHNPILKWAKDS